MAEITVTPDGRLVFVYDDALQPLLAEGNAQTRRVSHVEPDQNAAGEPGWSVDLCPIGGPCLGWYPLRADALAAEVGYLQSPEGRALLLRRAAG